MHIRAQVYLQELETTLVYMSRSCLPEGGGGRRHMSQTKKEIALLVCLMELVCFGSVTLVGHWTSVCEDLRCVKAGTVSQ